MSADPELLSKLKFFTEKPAKDEPTKDQCLMFYINLTDDWWQIEASYISNGVIRITTYHTWGREKAACPPKKDVVQIKDFAGWGLNRNGNLSWIASSFNYEEFGNKYEQMLKVFGMKMPFGKWRTGVSRFELPLIIHDVKQNPSQPFEVALVYGRITTKGVAHSNIRTRLPVTDKMYLSPGGTLVAPLQPVIDAIRNNVNKFTNPLAFKAVSNGSFNYKYMEMKWYKKPKPVKTEVPSVNIPDQH